MNKSPYIQFLKERVDLLKPISELVRIHEQFIAKLDEVNETIYKKVGPQGPKGDRGPKGDTPEIDYEYIINELRYVKDGRDGKDGKDGTTPTKEDILKIIKPYLPDEQDIVEKASKKVKPLIIKEVDSFSPEKFIEYLNSGKILLDIKYIKGLNEILSSLQTKRTGYIHGGGDTVEAGSGVSITKNAEGKKVISASGSGLSILEATGTIDDSNTTFTFTSEPQMVVVNGAMYRNGSGCSISGTTVTLDNPVGTGGSIFGLG